MTEERRKLVEAYRKADDAITDAYYKKLPMKQLDEIMVAERDVLQALRAYDAEHPEEVEE